MKLGLYGGVEIGDLETPPLEEVLPNTEQLLLLNPSGVGRLWGWWDPKLAKKVRVSISRAGFHVNIQGGKRGRKRGGF